MRVKGFVFVALLSLFMLITACAKPTPTPAPTFSFRSTAFDYGQPIPARYTCDGDDLSPPLTWSSPPANVQTYTLLVKDPDAPMGTFVHWVLYDISAERSHLPEGIPPLPTVKDVGVQGVNDFGPNVIGYRGPCPPPGKPHRYFFTLYALNARLNLPPGVRAKEVEQAMKGHILAQGEWMGTYKRESP